MQRWAGPHGPSKFLQEHGLVFITFFRTPINAVQDELSLAAKPKSCIESRTPMAWESMNSCNGGHMSGHGQISKSRQH